MKSKVFDIKSFIIGILITLLFISVTGAGNGFSPDETNKLKILSSFLNPDGNLNLGKRRIIMQGSSIYDDSSQGGGLIIRGGANRVHVHGSSIFYDNPDFKQPVLTLNADLNMAKHKIIMQGSSIYDDSSEGGGLILKGGANRIHVHGAPLMYTDPVFQNPVVNINADLNMAKHKIIMQGSSIYDDSSEGGGLILKGGANRIHVHGAPLMYTDPVFQNPVVNINADLNMAKHRIVMQGSSIYDDSSEGGGLIVRGGASRIHFFGSTIQH